MPIATTAHYLLPLKYVAIVAKICTLDALGNANNVPCYITKYALNILNISGYIFILYITVRMVS